MNLNLTELRKIAEEASQDGWGPYSANVPFYAVVTKPSPSLSKHDESRPTYWRVQDATFIAAFNPKKVLELLNEIDRLKQIEYDKNNPDW